MNKVLHVCAFKDNYIWLILDSAERHAVIVDPGDAAPVFETLQARRLTPKAILCTHHHADHVGGAAAIAQRFPVPVYGPAHESIPAVTQFLREGDRVDLAEFGLHFSVLDVPGHTAGHIAYYGAGRLFCGDTLFSAGCGRLFEGTAAQLYGALQKFARLPDATQVYCAHEYTTVNLRFALTVEPNNRDAARALREVETLRARNLPSLPSTIGREKMINPFLRTAHETVRGAAQQYAQRILSSQTEIFAALREWKDGFI